MSMLDTAMTMLARKMQCASHRMIVSRDAMRMNVPTIANAEDKMWIARAAKQKADHKMRMYTPAMEIIVDRMS
jgi:hypothetical protein